MLVIFVLDTSASMAARSGAGLSLLDQGKAIAEHYVKVLRKERGEERRRSPPRPSLDPPPSPSPNLTSHLSLFSRLKTR